MYQLPDDSVIKNAFADACKSLEIDGSRRNMAELVIYDMTDGTRTSTDLKGPEAYFDGGLFVMRFIHTLKILGSKNSYINVIHEGHKDRVNYRDIYAGMRRHVDAYREYALENDVRLRFLGKYDEKIDPRDVADYDLREDLMELERLTAGNTGHTAHFLINYSSRWAAEEAGEFYKALPAANVILRHAKGYVNGDMWLYGKLDNNSFVYVQNGSSSVTWSDGQMVWLIALCLRSMLLSRGTHLSKKYAAGEREVLRQKREVELSFIHKSFYDESSEPQPPKRVIIFSSYGPEVYEF
ncbi:MAG: hypothetical protein ACE5G7_02225 [Candidatus Hydrothermarchaeaceae archaeon]